MKSSLVFSRLCVTILAVVLLYLFSIRALWVVYDMRPFVDGRAYTLSQAHSMDLRMGLITTSLILLAIISGRLFVGRSSPARTAIVCSLATGFILGIYTFLNFWWRNTWTPTSTSGPFFPPSDLNSNFFKEFMFLDFLFFFTPLAMIASGLISYAYWRLTLKTQIAIEEAAG